MTYMKPEMIRRVIGYHCDKVDELIRLRDGTDRVPYGWPVARQFETSIADRFDTIDKLAAMLQEIT